MDFEAIDSGSAFPHMDVGDSLRSNSLRSKRLTRTSDALHHFADRNATSLVAESAKTMTKGQMDLPESAVRDAQEITDRLNLKSKAVTVTTALRLTNDIVRLAGERGEVLVKDGYGHAAKLDVSALFA